MKIKIKKTEDDIAQFNKIKLIWSFIPLRRYQKMQEQLLHFNYYELINNDKNIRNCVYCRCIIAASTHYQEVSRFYCHICKHYVCLQCLILKRLFTHIHLKEDLTENSDSRKLELTPHTKNSRKYKCSFCFSPLSNQTQSWKCGLSWRGCNFRLCTLCKPEGILVYCFNIPICIFDYNDLKVFLDPRLNESCIMCKSTVGFSFYWNCPKCSHFPICSICRPILTNKIFRCPVHSDGFDLSQPRPILILCAVCKINKTVTMYRKCRGEGCTLIVCNACWQLMNDNHSRYLKSQA